MRPRMRPAVALVCLLCGLASSAAVTASGLVVVVSSASPDMTLSQSQVADIFLGRAHRFPDGRRAVPIDRGDGSPLREAFYAQVIQRSPAQVKAHWSKLIFTGRGRPPPQIDSDAEAKRLLAGNPEAITYLASDEVDASVRVVGVE